MPHHGRSLSVELPLGSELRKLSLLLLIALGVVLFGCDGGSNGGVIKPEGSTAPPMESRAEKSGKS